MFKNLIFIFVILFIASLSGDLKAKCPDIENIKVTESYGIQICAMPKVDQKYLEHAKKVMDKLIDYNGDGLVDNQMAIDKVISTGSPYVVFSSGREENKFLDEFYSDEAFDYMDECEELKDEETCIALAEEKYGTWLAVFTNEMNLSGSGWDATIEEGLHLITHMGYAQAYPGIFGQHKDSEIAKFMDIARGGYFEDAQRRYPNGAYYTYDDRSCSYACQITEYTFWAITSLRGHHIDRAKEIRDEWRPNTPEKMREVDPALVVFLSKDEYGIHF
jgi:hypothetical protein